MGFELLKRTAIFVIITWVLVSIPFYQYQEREKIILKSTQKSNELVILNWSSYIDPELVKEFERQNNIQIKMIYFDDDYHRNLLLEAGDSRGVDIVLLDELGVHFYKKKGWLSPINNQQIPNLANIDPVWLSRYPNADGFSVPYFWGTSGIIYRRDLVSEPIENWMQILQPGSELQGHIQMELDPNSLVLPAMLALGYDMYSETLEEYQKAIDLIQQQRPFVHTYASVDMDKKAGIVQGNILVAMAYSGDAMRLMAFDDDLEYVVPEEGGTLWMDFFAVMEQSNKKDLAYSFLHFLNIPKNAAKNSEFVQYASANRGAEAYLSKDFLENPVIFPDEETLARCISQKTLSGWVQYKIDKSLAYLLTDITE